MGKRSHHINSFIKRCTKNHFLIWQSPSLILVTQGQSHYPNHKLLTSESMQVDHNCTSNVTVYFLNYSWTFSQLKEVFSYCHTSGSLLHKTEIVGAWKIYSYSNQPFTFSCSYLQFPHSPTTICLMLPSCQLTIAKFISEVPVAKSNKCHSCLLIFLAVFARAEHALLSFLPWHCILVVYLLLSCLSLPTNPSLNVDIPPVVCLQPFLLASYSFFFF